MSPAEFFFLALGLVVGVAAGAALLDVLRARPPVREVRLTVTHNALPPRDETRVATDGEDIVARPVMAAALAGVGAGTGTGAVATMTMAPRILTPALATAAAAGPATASAAGLTPAEPLNLATTESTGVAAVAVPVARGSDPTLAAVAVPVARESDPTLAAIRAMRRDTTPAPAGAPQGKGRTAVGAAAGVTFAEVLGRPRSHGTQATALECPRSQGTKATALERPRSHGTQAAAVTARSVGQRQGSTSSRRAGGGGSSAHDPLDRCAGERLLATERCAVAHEAREQADAAAGTLRDAQRTYDTILAEADAAARESDPRWIAEAKDAARRAFRAAHDHSRSMAEREAAAAAWLNEINRINQVSRRASQVLQRARQQAVDLAGTIDRLSLAADASRITAETAAHACQEAREALAACEEAASGAYAADAMTSPRPAARTPLAPPPDEPAEVVEEAALAAAWREAGPQPAVFRLLQGDRATLGRIVTALAAGDADEHRHFQLMLSELVDAVVAGAIEQAVLDFPTEHAFWGDFDRQQCRDIAVALASLGYRFDGLGGFVMGRAPGQRDLALALGYAGLDPMRIRRWPERPEELYREVSVAAPEYLATRAPDLSLGEMVTLLGRRSEALADLWNAWGRVRPLLLATVD